VEGMRVYQGKVLLRLLFFRVNYQFPEWNRVYKDVDVSTEFVEFYLVELEESVYF
jgi:hypothetical protein